MFSQCNRYAIDLLNIVRPRLHFICFCEGLLEQCRDIQVLKVFLESKENRYSRLYPPLTQLRCYRFKGYRHLFKNEETANGGTAVLEITQMCYSPRMQCQCPNCA